MDGIDILNYFKEEWYFEKKFTYAINIYGSFLLKNDDVLFWFYPGKFYFLNY